MKIVGERRRRGRALQARAESRLDDERRTPALLLSMLSISFVSRPSSHVAQSYSELSEEDEFLGCRKGAGASLDLSAAPHSRTGCGSFCALTSSAPLGPGPSSRTGPGSAAAPPGPSRRRSRPCLDDSSACQSVHGARLAATMLLYVRNSFAPRKGHAPVSIWYTTHPNDHQSMPPAEASVCAGPRPSPPRRPQGSPSI